MASGADTLLARVCRGRIRLLFEEFRRGASSTAQTTMPPSAVGSILVTGWEKDHVIVKVRDGVVLNGRWLTHAGLDSEVPECKDTGHRGSGVARGRTDATNDLEERSKRDSTPETLSRL